MDWSRIPLPDMRLEGRFGDRVIPAFASRPKHIWQMVTEAEARQPDGEALVCGDRRMTWREVVRDATAISAGLAAQGVEAGDRVAFLLGNRIEFVLTLFAAARIGAISVLLSIRQQKPEIAYVLNNCGAKLIYHEADLAERLPDATEIPDLKVRISTGATAGSIPFETLLAAQQTPPPADPAEEDTAMILYTSGTTGRPKGAMLAHCNIIHSSMVYEACMQLTHKDRSIAVVPLAHVTGVVANITTMARCAGTLVIEKEFKAANYLAVAARERVTYTVMVPAMYNLCLLQADFANFDLSAWRIGGYGGAPMPVATIERLAKHLPGLKLMNAYGSTETASPSTIMPGDLTAQNIDSVGLACPGAIIIVTDEYGHEVPRGDVGEIWIHGGSVIKGYWNNPQATAESFIGGFWRSGDLGTKDEQNFIRVLDRKKDMINRGGLKIYSAEVESVLAGHPGVAESAVIARPCPVLGERVHAVVVTRDGATREQDLKAWCAERLSDYKVPETFALGTDPLPRNANGKVMKRTLREA